MNNDIIKEKVLSIVEEYPVKRIVLFGSRAEETNQENSDVDLSELYERLYTFTKPSWWSSTFMGLATIKKISIPVPSINLQKQFAEFLVQIDKSKVAVQKALDKTQLLIDSLMHGYFR